MSYGGYNAQNGGGYGQSNPYAQQNYGEGGRGYTGAGNGPAYGAGPFSDQAAENVEMQQYDAQPSGRQGGLPSGPGPQRTGGGGGYEGAGYGSAGGSTGDDLLNQCRDIDQAIDDLGRRLAELQGLHNRVLNDRASNNEVDRMNSEVMGAYRNLGDKLKKVKSNPESGNPRNAPQVGRVDRKLKKAINDFQRVESDFRRQMQDAQARQYRIVNPAATDDEVQEAVEDPNTQIFQQALLNSDRRGQAQSTLSAVRQRHNEIQRIEQTIVELGQLFEDLDRIVLEHEPLIMNIEQKGEEVQQNVEAGVGELDKGVKSARAARKKKWICFWIVIVLIIVIILIVVIYLAVNGKLGGKKSTSAPATTTTAAARMMIKRAVPLALMAAPEASY